MSLQSGKITLVPTEGIMWYVHHGWTIISLEITRKSNSSIIITSHEGDAHRRPIRIIALTTRHRASTSMYSLTFRVRVATPPQYGRNGTAHAAGASIFSPARGVFAGMRSAWHCLRRAVGLADYHCALPRISSVAIATQPVHRLQIRPTVHN